MAAYAFMVPMLPGQEEANRSFHAEMSGPRRTEYETAWRGLELRTDRVWHQVTPQGTFAIIYLEAEDMGRVFAGIATSDDPFLVWFRSQVLAIHGLDLTQPMPGSLNEQVHDWSND